MRTYPEVRLEGLSSNFAHNIIKNLLATEGARNYEICDVWYEIALSQADEDREDATEGARNYGICDVWCETAISQADEDGEASPGHHQDGNGSEDAQTKFAHNSKRGRDTEDGDEYEDGRAGDQVPSLQAID